ncbi:serine hydrolase domain-containing protein [Nocardia nepalensis]|uniref:serine hydrolase domain-containing protein n=1 Tax=Nocardia nepalensis TaxID=3375448 RepID=UPI003B66C1B6
MDNTIAINGTVAPGFDAVREEFAAVVAEENGESGAQLAAFVHGTQVVDLWAGPRVTGDTLTGLLSATKGASSLVVALLVQEGWLDLDRAVADYWPEFGAAGKSGITLRQVLTNRRIAARVATQWPYIRPNSAQAYGGFISFAIVGEVVRRAAGGSIQELFEERIRAPYGLDVYLGLPASDDRYLPILPWLATPEMQAAFEANSPGSHSIPGIAYNLNAADFTPADVLTLPNDPEVRALGQGSAGGVGSARGLAAMYAAAISGVDGRGPLLKSDTLAVVTAIHSTGPDLVRGERAPYALGFEAKGLYYPFLSANAFGHTGAAGCDGFADPRSGLSYGYTRRRAAFGFSAPENDRLAAVVHHAAGR